MSDQPQLIELRTEGGASATVFPDFGMNCIALDLVVDGEPLAVLHSEPDVLSGGAPTRSGMPVLFPFPSRIAGAAFEWRGKHYDLPPSRPGGADASHGFACRSGWSDYVVTADGRSVTGRFRLSDDPAANWPGNLVLDLTYTLSDDSLQVEAAVTNDALDASAGEPGQVGEPAPFGIGFHSYFTPLGDPAGPAGLAECSIECQAAGAWDLAGTKPLHRWLPVSGRNDLRAGVLVDGHPFDDVLTDLPPFDPESDGLMSRATLTRGNRRIDLRCDKNWREIVVFTPANRESIAIEPYTCPTDAVHLAGSGLDVGWRVLEPGDSWIGAFEIRAERRAEIGHPPIGGDQGGSWT